MNPLQVERFNDELTLHQCIIKVFEGDTDLLQHYHFMRGSELSVCIKNTFENILDASHNFVMDWHKLLYQGDVVGYLVTSQSIMGVKVLYSFGLNKEVRKSLAKDLFSSIRQIIGNDFISILWSHNTRAIDYLVKNGMKEVSKTEQTVTLILCP